MMMRGSASTSSASTSGTDVVIYGVIRYLTGGWYVRDGYLFLGVTNGHHDDKEEFYVAEYINEIHRC